MRLPSMLALLGAAALASAARLTVSIPPSPPVLPNPAALPPSTHATLIGAPGNKHSAIIRRDNTIVFENLPEDSYLLAVHTRDHFFPPYRVDIGHAESNPGQEIVQVWQTFRGNEWSNKGPLLAQGDSNLRVDVRPAATKEYYQQRGGFNLIGFLKSPMILMGLFSVVMIFGMPYLMENSKSPIVQDTVAKNLGNSNADYKQWTPRPRQSSRTCRRTARSQAQTVQQTRYRTSTLLASCLGSPTAEFQLEVDRRDEATLC